MNKKLVFVIQVESDQQADAVRASLFSWRYTLLRDSTDKKIKIQIDEVKTQ